MADTDTVSRADIVAEMLAMTDLRAGSASRGRDVADALVALGADEETVRMVASDVRDVLDGSAIECVYTIGGHKVEITVDDLDYLVVEVDGDEVHRSDV